MVEAVDGASKWARINQAARIQVLRFGRSAEPIIVVDDALLDPGRLIDEAAGLHFAPADEGRGGYPGVRARAPDQLALTILQPALPLIGKLFGLDKQQLAGFDASYSIVTADPDALHPLQRVPHIDTRDPRRIAILLYLGRRRTGGTSFFRQDSTGFEQVGPKTFETYRAARTEDLARLPADAAYPSRETPGYTETAHFEARFNRLLIYRSCTLHSGALPPDFDRSADPREGRLTANIFVDFAPPSST
jgi:hypothetical protein